MSSTRIKPFTTILLALLGLLILAAVLTPWYINTHQKALDRKFSQWLATATDSVYHIRTGHISVSLLRRSITLTGVHIWPDTNRLRALQATRPGYDIYYHINIPRLTVSGINLLGLLGKRDFSCNVFGLQQPRIMVTKVDLPFRPPATPQPDKEKIKKLYAAHIRIRDVNITWRHITTQGTEYTYLDHGDLHLRHWTYEPGKNKEHTTLPAPSRGHISFQRIRQGNGADLYYITCGKINFTTHSRQLTVNNFSLRPAVSYDQFYKLLGHRAEIFSVTLPQVTIEKLDWQQLLTSGTIKAEKAAFTNLSLNVYFSFLPPPGTQTRMGKFPQQILQRLGVPIYIRDIDIHNAVVRYTEVSGITRMPGTIAFTSINGDIKNFTNIPSYIQGNSSCLANLSGRFNQRSGIRALFNFYLGDSSGRFDVSATLGRLDAPQISGQAKALALTDVKSLTIDTSTLHIWGDEYRAYGRFSMHYHDLKVKIQKMEKTGEITNRGLASFVLNHALLYDQNPEPGKPLRTAANLVSRDPMSGFFHLLWKSIFDGALKIIGRNPDVAKIAESKARS